MQDESVKQVTRQSAKRSARDGANAKTITVTVACVVLVIATVVGARFLHVPFYAASMVVIVVSIVPFLVSFEGRKPQARELVILAVMCAIAVASRVAFFWLPQFKPMAGIVMITGIALGAQSGFLAGVLSVLVSNFMFGQGYWTLWQMLAFGLAGLVFGLLADCGVIKRENLTMKGKIGLAIGGGLFVQFILGPILDTSSLVVLSGNISVTSAAAIYISGAPMNAVHAVATIITLFLLANPILDKLARVRKKYGLMKA